MTTTVSTLVSNMTTIPRVVNAKALYHKEVKVVMDSVTVPDTANADIVILAPIPVDAIILSVDLTTADLGSAGTIDIGFYKSLSAGDPSAFTVVDKDCIADNLDVSTSIAVARTGQRIAGIAADAMNQKAWEIAGLTARPDYSHFYIGLTTDTGTTVAGTASITIMYTV